jgi:hypothetical protein
MWKMLPNEAPAAEAPCISNRDIRLLRGILLILLRKFSQRSSTNNLFFADESTSKTSLIALVRLCEIAHIGPGTCKLLSDKKFRQFVSDRGFGLSRAKDKTREVQVEEEKNESNNNNGSGGDCLSGQLWAMGEQVNRSYEQRR